MRWLDSNKRQKRNKMRVVSIFIGIILFGLSACSPKQEVVDNQVKIDRLNQYIMTLSAKVDSLEAELTAKHEADFIAKSKEVFAAIADNKLTLAQGEDLIALSSADVSAKIAELKPNATGFGEVEKPSEAPGEDVYAVYQSLTGTEKTAHFKAHKQEILNQINKES